MANTQSRRTPELKKNNGLEGKVGVLDAPHDQPQGELFHIEKQVTSDCAGIEEIPNAG